MSCSYSCDFILNSRYQPDQNEINVHLTDAFRQCFDVLWWIALLKMICILSLELFWQGGFLYWSQHIAHITTGRRQLISLLQKNLVAHLKLWWWLSTGSKMTKIKESFSVQSFVSIACVLEKVCVSDKVEGSATLFISKLLTLLWEKPTEVQL